MIVPLPLNFAWPRAGGRVLAWSRAGGRVLGALLAIIVAGCAPGRDLPVLSAPLTESYHLGVGDEVRIITYGQDQLSEDFRVSDSGDIAVPLLGLVHAGGLTTRELQARIADGLVQKSLMREPSVSVEITAYRPIFVLGEVARPGQYPYQPGMTMLTAVTVAGGFTYRSVEDYAYVIRQGGPYPTQGRLLPQGVVEPGDVIKVYERLF